jgi:phosphate transport system substrate-binding protein
VGSGEGEKGFLTEKVDFGGTDEGLKADQVAAVPRGAVQVPVTAGIVVLAYNAEGLPADLRLSRDVYVDIFLGKGVKWNDPRIQAANSRRAASRQGRPSSCGRTVAEPRSR